MVMARENGKPIFPIKLKRCELPGLLSGIQSIDLTVDRDSGYWRLALGLKEHGLDPTDVFAPDPTRPLPGLRPLKNPDPTSSNITGYSIVHSGVDCCYS